MRPIVPSVLALSVWAVLLIALPAAADVTLHPTSAMLRIGGADGSPNPPAADRYRMDVVRGEAEGLQVVVLPAGTGSTDIAVQVKRASTSAPAVRLYRVVSVRHTAPPTEGMFVVPPRRLGLVPDVLVPLDVGERLTAERPSPGQPPLTLYVEFTVGRDTALGEATYDLVVTAGQSSRTLRVSVRVHDVTLPVRLPFRTAATWNWSLTTYYGRDLTVAEKRVFWDFCLDYRLSPCAFFSRMPDPDPSQLAELQGRGLSLVCLMQVSGRTPRPLSDKAKATYAPLLKRWRSQLDELGLLHDAVILLADEPPADSIDICRANAAFFKQHYPELKIWVATTPSPQWAAFADVFDVVTAHSTDLYARHSHDADAANQFRKLKPFPRGEYWWFHSVEPYAPYPNVRLDNLPIEARISGWQSALYGVDGYEYFWIAAWADNTETRDVAWPQRGSVWNTGLSGAGTLCYPDTTGRPLPSLRLVNLRDGIEDWALIEMLAPDRTDAARRSWVAPVTTDLATFTVDPDVILGARRSVMVALAGRQMPSHLDETRPASPVTMPAGR